MSRIGTNPITVPSSVTISVADGVATVKGPNGTMSRVIPDGITLSQDGDVLTVSRVNDETMYRSLHGLTRTLVANMVEGVSKGFRKSLEIQGVGYRASKAGENLNLTLGYSHPVSYPAPSGISFAVEGTNKIHVDGIDKQRVGQVAAEIRDLRPPEPYKGKGIRYEGEVVRKKLGKAGKAGKK